MWVKVEKYLFTRESPDNKPDDMEHSNSFSGKVQVVFVDKLVEFRSCIIFTVLYIKMPMRCSIWTGRQRWMEWELTSEIQLIPLTSVCAMITCCHTVQNKQG